MLHAECAVCQMIEDTFHLFFQCKVVDTWDVVIPNVAQVLIQTTLTQGWEGIFAFAHTRDLIELILYICWNLWRNRNKAHYDLSCNLASSIAKSALSLCNEFKEGNQKKAVHNHSSTVRWFPTPAGYVKVNVDDAWYSEQGKAIVAAVARD